MRTLYKLSFAIFVFFSLILIFNISAAKIQRPQSSAQSETDAVVATQEQQKQERIARSEMKKKSDEIEQVASQIVTVEKKILSTVDSAVKESLQREHDILTKKLEDLNTAFEKIAEKHKAAAKKIANSKFVAFIKDQQKKMAEKMAERRAKRLEMQKKRQEKRAERRERRSSRRNRI